VGYRLEAKATSKKNTKPPKAAECDDSTFLSGIDESQTKATGVSSVTHNMSPAVWYELKTCCGFHWCCNQGIHCVAPGQCWFVAQVMLTNN